MAKKKYYVVYTYDIQIYDDWDRRKSEERIAGSTWAVSEAQAIRNVMYRMGLKNSDLECFGPGYYRETRFVARAA